MAKSKREKQLEAALLEFLEITEPAARLLPEDPDYGADVRRLGDRIGYGAMMASAQAAWRSVLAQDGLEGGEHTHGPCYAVLMRARERARKALSQ